MEIGPTLVAQWPGRRMEMPRIEQLEANDAMLKAQLESSYDKARTWRKKAVRDETEMSAAHAAPSCEKEQL